jgi:hypothetical protein
MFLFSHTAHKGGLIYSYLVQYFTCHHIWDLEDIHNHKIFYGILIGQKLSKSNWPIKVVKHEGEVGLGSCIATMVATVTVVGVASTKPKRGYLNKQWLYMYH